MIITQILTKNAAKYKNKIALVEQDFFSGTKKKSIGKIFANYLINLH